MFLLLIFIVLYTFGAEISIIFLDMCHLIITFDANGTSTCITSFATILAYVVCADPTDMQTVLVYADAAVTALAARYTLVAVGLVAGVAIAAMAIADYCFTVLAMRATITTDGLVTYNAIVATLSVCWSSAINTGWSRPVF